MGGGGGEGMYVTSMYIYVCMYVGNYVVFNVFPFQVSRKGTN